MSKNTCPCGKPITKGYFKKCYECNVKDKVDSDDEDTTKNDDVIPYKKMTIPKTVKNCLWINYFGDKRVGVCACCLREPITINNFHAGHIKSEKEFGPGSTTLDNLAPICPLCNLSMGTAHMIDDFIKKYNLHYGLGKTCIVE